MKMKKKLVGLILGTVMTITTIGGTSVLHRAGRKISDASPGEEGK